MPRVTWDQRGAAAVELALVLPLFLVLIFGTVEFGLALHAKGLLASAAREGARFGVVFTTPRKTEAEIQARVQNYLSQTGFAGPVAITVAGAGGNSGDPLRVTIQYDYRLRVLPRFINGMLGRIDLRTDTIMRME